MGGIFANTATEGQVISEVNSEAAAHDDRIQRKGKS